MIVASLLLILVAVALLVAGVVGSANALIVCSIVATVVAAIVLVIGVRQAPPAEPESELDMADGSPSGFVPPPAEPSDRGRQAGVPRRSSGQPYGAPAADTARGATAVREAAGRSGIPTQGGVPEHEAGGPDGPEAAGGPAGAFAHPPDDAEPFDRDAYDQGSFDDGYGRESSDRDAYDDEDPPDEPPAQVVSPSVASAVALLDTEVMVVDGRPRYHLDTCAHLRGRESEPIPVGEAVELGFTPCGRCEPDSALLEDARRG